MAMSRAQLLKELLPGLNDLFDVEYARDYHYARRKHGKWTIYDRYGWQLVGRLNEREMKNYMKLLGGK